jgi:hypothetical protein
MKWPGIVPFAVALIAVAGGEPGLAQTSSPEPSAKPAEPSDDTPGASGPFALTRASILAQRQAIVGEAMDLDPRQTQAFWPLYREYRLAIGKVNDRYVSLLTRYLDSYPDLPDAVAGQLLDESLSIEEARTQERRQYLSRFRKVLPDRQVARFFQVESKLDAVVNAELAQRVPLVE